MRYFTVWTLTNKTNNIYKKAMKKCPEFVRRKKMIHFQTIKTKICDEEIVLLTYKQ
jgi:hypothetical protein